MFVFLKKLKYNKKDLNFLSNKIENEKDNKILNEIFFNKIYEKYKNSVVDKKINSYGESQNDYSIIIWNHDKTKGTRYDIESKKIIGIKVGDTNLTLMEGCA